MINILKKAQNNYDFFETESKSESELVRPPVRFERPKADFSNFCSKFNFEGRSQPIQGYIYN